MRCRYAGIRAGFDLCKAGTHIQIDGGTFSKYCDSKDDNYVNCSRFKLQYAIDNPDHELKSHVDKQLATMGKRIEDINALFETTTVTLDRISERVDKLEKRVNNKDKFLENNL